MKKFLILPFVLVAGNWCRRCGVLKIRHRMSDFEVGRALIILLALLVGAAAAPATAQAAERYWVGGTGSWSDDDNHWATTWGGAPADGNVPTATDNAHFNADSNTTAYTVTVDASATMLDLMFDAAPSVSGTITWAGSSAMTISGSMLLLSGMAWTYTGTITFNATATGKTITSNGVNLANTFIFDGVSGGWTLQDDLNLNASFTGNITVTNSHATTGFNTNGKTISAKYFWSSNSNTRSIILGASAITLTGAASALEMTTTGLTLDAGTSVITFNAPSPGFVGGGLTFYDVSFSAVSGASGSLQGANSFHNLSIAGTDSAAVMSLYANQTITGTFTVSSTDAKSHILIKSDTVGTPRTITAAAVSLQDVDFTDITGLKSGVTLNPSDKGSNMTLSGGNLTGT